jgi:mercuric ion transport protein
MNTQESAAAPSCSCTPKQNNRLLKWSVGGGLLASLGLCAACCLLPMVFIGLGAGGAWISSLDALAPYKWLFIGATVGLLGYGFYAAYWKPKRRCVAGASCPTCGTSRTLRIVLWAATVIAIAGVLFEQLERHFDA